MQKNALSKATLGRLPYYLQYLKDALAKGERYISATAIAQKLSLGDVLVRKDLNSVCRLGRPKIGYGVEDLTRSIEDALGCNNLTNAVILGAGRLGRALLDYEGFKDYGVCILAAFDVCANEQKAGHKPILHPDSFESYCKSHNVAIGIITVNEESAQSVCDLMIKSGIRAIWNFTPKRLTVPQGVVVQQENLALSLAHLKQNTNKI